MSLSTWEQQALASITDRLASSCSRRHPARSTRRSRRQAAIRSVIATLIPCSRRVMFSKLNGLTCFLAPLLPAPP